MVSQSFQFVFWHAFHAVQVGVINTRAAAVHRRLFVKGFTCRLLTERFNRFFHGMLRRGVYLPPAQWEAAFVSYAHERAQLDLTLKDASQFRVIGTGQARTDVRGGRVERDRRQVRAVGQEVEADLADVDAVEVSCVLLMDQ